MNKEVYNMEFNKDTKLKDILAEYPWLREELIKQEPKFKLLDSPLGKIILKKATIGDLSEKSGYDVDYLIGELEKVIAEHESK